MPNHHCCVAMCKSRNKRDDVKFIRFPADPILSDKWKFVIGREPGFKVTKNTRICSLHFVSGKRSYESDCIDYIPSIFPFTSITHIQYSPFSRIKHSIDTSNFSNSFNDELASSSQFEYENRIKKRKINFSSTTDDIECEPDIYPIDNNFINHFQSVKTNDCGCQTDQTYDEVEELISVKNKLINDIEQLRKEISYLKDKKCELTKEENSRNFDEIMTEVPKLDLNLLFQQLTKSFNEICKKWMFLNQDDSVQAIQLSDGPDPLVQRSLLWNEYGNLKINVHNRDLGDSHGIWKKINRLMHCFNVFDVVPRILETVFVVSQYDVCSGNFEVCYQNQIQSGFDRDDKGLVGYKEMDFKEKINVNNNVDVNSTMRSINCVLLVDRGVLRCKSCQLYKMLMDKRLK